MQLNLHRYKRMSLPEKIAYLKQLITELNTRLAAVTVGTDRRNAHRRTDKRPAM